MANFNTQVFGDIDLSNDVLHRLGELCMSAKHSDVTFVVEDTPIPAHKTILTARSSYFEKLFGGGFAESTQSEIKLKVPLDAFKLILRFIYTGYMSLAPLNVNQIVDVYGLVELYDIEALKETISKYMAAKLALDNCVDILNAAYLHSQDDLQNACLTFMDGRSTELIKHETFKSMPSTVLCTLLKRDTFFAPEIDIFVAVKDWIGHNPASDSKALFSMVRWSLISMDEFIDVVEPSNILDPPQLMAIMKKSRESTVHRIPCSSAKSLVLGENFASAEYGAEMISGEEELEHLSEDLGGMYHPITKSYKYDSIIVELGKIQLLNYIELLLCDKDKRSYSYYIDVSVDGDRYRTLIDFTSNYGRSKQFLHFPSLLIQFIKLVGIKAINFPTDHTKSVTYKDGNSYLRVGVKTFDVDCFKAMYIEGHDSANWVVPGYLKPKNNVADRKIGAIVLEGGGGNSMLNENMYEFTCHLRNDHILLQLNQPYYISSMRMLLGCDKVLSTSLSNQYSFYIETSLDNVKWQMAVDKRDESLSGWQQFEFEERPVVFVKIVGTQSDNDFVCTYFECPSSARQPNLRQAQSTLPSSTTTTTK